MGAKIFSSPNEGPQFVAWDSFYIDEVLYGGGRGSGKSWWLIFCFETQTQMHPGQCNGIIFRETEGELSDLVEKAKEMLVPRLAKYTDKNKKFTFHCGSVLRFSHIKRLSDYNKYHGHEFTYIGMDELTRFADWQIKTNLMSTLRTKHKGIRCIARFTANPGGTLHNEVKEYFVDPAPKGGKVMRNKEGLTRMYVFSRAQDNPYIYDNNPKYMAWLRSLPKSLYEAWYEGRWDYAVGAMFSDLWNKDIHIIAPMRANIIPATTTRYRAMDWGSSTPFCFLWYFISDGTELNDRRVYPRGAIVIFREYYGWELGTPKNEGLRIPNHDLAVKVKHIEDVSNDHQMTDKGPADNQIFNEMNGVDSDLHAAFKSEGVPFKRSNKSAGSSVIGWDQIRQRLSSGLLFVTSDCTNTIRTLPSIPRDAKNPEDISKHCEDHAVDVIKYICLDNELPSSKVEAKVSRKLHKEIHI